mgnify:CR=1 FL=1
MSDIIRLLPESLANQIAAGEVVQRPASAVKELLENSVDAGATSIQLIVKEAGKQLIRVIDNGAGMSETDARHLQAKNARRSLPDSDKRIPRRGPRFHCRRGSGRAQNKKKRVGAGHIHLH